LNEVATGKLSNDEFLKRSQARATGAGVGLFLVADGYFGFPITGTALKVGGIGGAFVVAGHIGELHTNGNVSDPGERKARLEQTNKDLVFDVFFGFAGTQLFKFAGLTRSAGLYLFSTSRFSRISFGLKAESKLGFNVPRLTSSIGSEDLNLPRLDSHQSLQLRFEYLAEKELLPKYRAIDPNLEAGYTGSFKTGRVGNPKKPTFGQEIDHSSFDIDYWIKSDVLRYKFGPRLVGNRAFRATLSKTPGFEGLRPGKKGFSILFKPQNKK
jgi:hypothetical protein